jgi:DNA repair exonuclease SbcCD nuclease subunit
MAFRFLHTADLHLDSPLKSLALRDPELKDLIGGATRKALQRMVDVCLAERVDAFVIAGDLYDGDLKSMATGLFLGRELKRLSDAGIRTFLIRGNHDAQSVVTKELEWPALVHVFDHRGTPVELAEGSVVVHGVSFAKSDAPESLLPRFHPPVAGAYNIGLLHTSLGGSPGHDVYSPTSVNDLKRHGFDYWALGHIHARTVHSEAPAIVMPGMPQGRDINEAGPKSATLVTVDPRGKTALSAVPTASAVFERVTLDVTDLADKADLARRFDRVLETAARAIGARAGEVTLVARVKLTGVTALSNLLRRDADVILNEAKAAGERVGAVAIESVGVETRPEAAPSAPAGSDVAAPLAELRALAGTHGEASDETWSVARSMVQKLIGTLPPEMRPVFGTDDAAIMALTERLMAEGIDDVLARLDGDATREERAP